MIISASEFCKLGGSHSGYVRLRTLIGHNEISISKLIQRIKYTKEDLKTLLWFSSRKGYNTKQLIDLAIDTTITAVDQNSTVKNETVVLKAVEMAKTYSKSRTKAERLHNGKNSLALTQQLNQISKKYASEKDYNAVSVIHVVSYLTYFIWSLENDRKKTANVLTSLLESAKKAKSESSITNHLIQFFG